MDNFEILEKLGKGAFSKVYKVKRKIDTQVYALKKVDILDLSEKQKNNSLNEIRILASVNNKNIVNYKEAFIDEKDSQLCLVMEYAENGDLMQLINEKKQKNEYFKEIDIWRVFIQLVKGLKSLHDLRIIHRDIKCSNIFLFNDGIVKLGDLNVCKILSEKSIGSTQTGTPSYAAPEVWLQKPYGLKSDIWSLGCAIYEMICLRPPFPSKNVIDLCSKILKGEYKKIPDFYSKELNWLVMHMINLNENERLSCDEILECEIVKKYMDESGTFFFNRSNVKKKDSDNHLNSSEKLLKTIYLDKNNLLYLNEQMPKPKYSVEIKSTLIDNKSPLKEKNYKLKNKYNSSKKVYHINISNINNTSKAINFPNIKTNLNPSYKGTINLQLNKNRKINNIYEREKIISSSIDGNIENAKIQHNLLKMDSKGNCDRLKLILYKNRTKKIRGFKKDITFRLRRPKDEDFQNNRYNNDAIQITERINDNINNNINTLSNKNVINESNNLYSNISNKIEKCFLPKILLNVK